jgi:hypothetical protein
MVKLSHFGLNLRARYPRMSTFQVHAFSTSSTAQTKANRVRRPRNVMYVACVLCVLLSHAAGHPPSAAVHQNVRTTSVLAATLQHCSCTLTSNQGYRALPAERPRTTPHDHAPSSVTTFQRGGRSSGRIIFFQHRSSMHAAAI